MASKPLERHRAGRPSCLASGKQRPQFEPKAKIEEIIENR
jgi:hypothetical protein